MAKLWIIIPNLVIMPTYGDNFFDHNMVLFGQFRKSKYPWGQENNIGKRDPLDPLESIGCNKWIHWISIGYPLDLLKTFNYIQWILIDPLDPLDPFSGYRIDIQWIHWISNGSIEMDPLDPIAGCQVVQLIH